MQLIEPTLEESEWHVTVWLYDKNAQLLAVEKSLPITALNAFIASHKLSETASSSIQAMVLAPSIRAHVRILELKKGQVKYKNEIIPALMESYLAQPLEDLHFAHKMLGKDQLLVAAISKSHIEKWLEMLSFIAIERRILTLPQAVLCEKQAINADYDVRFMGESYRYSDGQIFALPRVNQSTEEPHNSLDDQMEPSEYLALQNSLPLNLLQGRFADKNNRLITMPFWKTLCGVFILVLLLSCGWFYYQAIQFREIANHIEDKTSANFLSLAPDEGKIINLKRQIEGRIRSQLNANSSIKKDLTLYKALHLIDEAQRQVSSPHSLQLLAYRNGIIYLEWKADSQETLEALSHHLEDQKLDVYLDQVMKNNQAYIASFRIQGMAQ